LKILEENLVQNNLNNNNNLNGKEIKPTKQDLEEVTIQDLEEEVNFDEWSDSIIDKSNDNIPIDINLLQTILSYY
jgi:hypothetical protein